MFERRKSPRTSVDLFFNRFLEGYPYLCRAVELSPRGVSVETFAEPRCFPERFPLELRFPKERETLWLWARRVRVQGSLEALEFVSLSGPARRRIAQYVVRTAMAA